AFRVTGARDPIALEVESRGTPAIGPTGRLPINLTNGAGLVVVVAGPERPTGGWEDLRVRLEAPYREGLLLETPAATINRAVPFNRYLLDLGFDGRFHVCELFRWRDVWSRDLGSGLVPGAMASGRFAAARTTLDYDLRRYAAAHPTGLKVTGDPSQGGSAEGTAWLARAVWREYMLTGDESFLEEAADTLRPWVKAWIDRDYDERGLLVDVTEWMDHSRFLLFPDGARVLYSNALFTGLLGTFSRIEAALGHTEAARSLDGVRLRFLRGVNAGLWNESADAYDNLSLWGDRDERLASGENALAVLCGVAPSDRARRALASVRARNWRAAGSVTIAPPMSHVDLHNDHNYKVWPWWNAVEARARLRNGDVDGGLELLDHCAATLQDRHDPGLVEELLTPEGVSEGGHAFLTAAGAYLDAVYEGLLGIEVLEPGCARIRVAPNVPEGWRNWHAQAPLPQGMIVILENDGRLHIRVTDPRVRVVEAPEGAAVEGAQRAPLALPAYPNLDEGTAPTPLAAASPHARTTAVLSEDGIPAVAPADLPGRLISAEDLLHLDATQTGALIVAGNALPRRTRTGGDVQASLARFLDGGGAIVFFGATTGDRGTMGETGGVIDWYEVRPAIRAVETDGWRFRTSQDGPAVQRENERGFREAWERPGLVENGWDAIEVPEPWEKHLGRDYDGWGWYRTKFRLPAAARGHVVVLDLGRVDDADWTSVNGLLVGSERDWKKPRQYRLAPGDAAYTGLVFGGDNILAVQVLDTGGAGGLLLDPTRVGIETADLAWTPVDPGSGAALDHSVRLGVVSWGPGGDFFNSWETSRGAFGFRIEGSGVEFVGPLA
ncbi:MAG TPA: hypothetical protein PKL08_17210, partial [Thermoanaerobaculaceae bacterium]|nr:hypothetical protein [Thermoanaerobaculaceae bacterium]